MTDRCELTALIDARVRDVADFPKPGVVFKDITPLLADPEAFARVVEAMAAAGRDDDGNVVVDKVVGMEARGFIFAAPVALALGAGFVPVRKPGKLPWRTDSVSYELEYASETLEMHDDALVDGDRVLIVDDHLTSCTLFAHVAQAWGMQLTYTCARNAFTVGTIIPRLVFALT